MVGITFSVSRSGAPLTGYLDFARALLETALNASVLRAQLALGMNSFVIRSDAGSFDFQRAFDRGLGAEYRETLVLAEAFFRGYVARAVAVRRRRAAPRLPSRRCRPSSPWRGCTTSSAPCVRCTASSRSRSPSSCSPCA